MKSSIGKILEVVGCAIVLYVLLCFVVRIASVPGATQAHRCKVHTYVALSSSQEAYWATNAKVSDRTSCLFARSVFKASLNFIIRAGGAGDGDFFIRAYSPVTHRNYRMHCEAHGMLTIEMHTVCRGGHGARVAYSVWEQG